MIENYSLLATFLSLAVKAHVHSGTHGLLRKPGAPMVCSESLDTIYVRHAFQQDSAPDPR